MRGVPVFSARIKYAKRAGPTCVVPPLEEGIVVLFGLRDE